MSLGSVPTTPVTAPRSPPAYPSAVPLRPPHSTCSPHSTLTETPTREDRPSRQALHRDGRRAHGDRRAGPPTAHDRRPRPAHCGGDPLLPRPGSHPGPLARVRPRRGAGPSRRDRHARGGAAAGHRPARRVAAGQHLPVAARRAHEPVALRRPRHRRHPHAGPLPRRLPRRERHEERAQRDHRRARRRGPPAPHRLPPARRPARAPHRHPHRARRRDRHRRAHGPDEVRLAHGRLRAAGGAARGQQGQARRRWGDRAGPLPGGGRLVSGDAAPASDDRPRRRDRVSRRIRLVSATGARVIPLDRLNPRVRARATLPSLFTLGNMLCGFSSVLLSFQGHFRAAAVLVGISIVLAIGEPLYDWAPLVPVVAGVVPAALMASSFRFRSFRDLLSPRHLRITVPLGIVIAVGLALFPGATGMALAYGYVLTCPLGWVTAPLRRRWFGEDAVAPPRTRMPSVIMPPELDEDADDGDDDTDDDELDD